MSHFPVAVFHKEDQNIEELLAPYDENISVEPYIWMDREEAITFARKRYGIEDATDEECWQMIAEGRMTDEEGNIYSTYNPNSKWDWWEVGGRWSNMLTSKDGEAVDSIRVGDLSISFGCKEDKFSTYAVVTPDGKWHAPGEVGWFGASSESEEELRDWQAHYRERFLDTADKDWILTICDCHI